MSNYSFDLQAGKTLELLTAGKYCDRNIVVNAVGGGGSDTPFKWLNYIETTGTQYIDPDLYANSDMRITADFELLEDTGAFQFLFGARTAASASDQFSFLFTNGGVWRTDYSSSRLPYSSSVVGVGRHTLDKNKNICVLDDTTITNTEASFTGAYGLVLFALNNAGTVQENIRCRSYSFHIYDNETLIRHLRPCQLGNDRCIITSPYLAVYVWKRTA